MRIVILLVGIVFCFFPYTKILPIESYTQPYALLFCTLGAIASFDLLAMQFPRGQALLFASLAVLGTIVFLFTCMPSPDPVELKSLLSYLSPIIFCMSGFALIRSAPNVAYRVTFGSAVAWIGVGVIQLLVSPTFATQFVSQSDDLAEAVAESGRGMLSFAPEPTHFGFHMLVFATALIILRKDRLILPGLCVLTALLVARSSSALLAIVLGSILHVTIFTKRGRVLLIAVVPGYFLLKAIVEGGLLPDSIRVVAILKLFFEDPAFLLMSDASVNARLGGVIVGFKEIIGNIFIPFGMSNQQWLESIGPILARNPWLYDLSTAGVPSGLLIIVYQCGIFGLIILTMMLRRLFSSPASIYQSWFLSIIFFVFMSQYTISTPGFGIIYGFLLATQGGIRPAWQQSATPQKLIGTSFGRPTNYPL